MTRSEYQSSPRRCVVRHDVSREFVRCGVVPYEGGTCGLMLKGAGIDMIVEVSRAQAALIALEAMEWVLGPLIHAFCMECQNIEANNRSIDTAIQKITSGIAAK